MKNGFYFDDGTNKFNVCLPVSLKRKDWYREVSAHSAFALASDHGTYIEFIFKTFWSWLET